MFFSDFISPIKSRLAVKSILVVIIFISAVSILFTVFFMTYQKRLLTGELYKRAYALARNFAYNSRVFFITKDKPVIQSLVSGVQEEPDIENVFLTDHDGTVLTSTDTTHTDETFTFPARHDSTGRINWYPIDDDMTMRMILPVEIKAPVIESDTLLYPPKETIPVSDVILSVTFMNCIFPGFTFNGEEVTFSAISNLYTPGLLLDYIVSASIENRTQRFLVQGYNSFWSHNGRYLAFNEGNPGQLAVLDTVTREKEIIASYGTGKYGVPCFTPDDRYVIVTLLSENGNERLFRIPRDGGKPEQLTFHDGQHWYPDCSPDGKWILYTEIEKKTLYVYNTETKKTSRVFPNLKDQHWSGSFSPDGTKFCYLHCLNVSPLSWDVFVADFPANGKPVTNANTYGTQLTFTGGSKWFTDWSPDGKLITYAQRQEIVNQIWIVPSQGGNPINLTGSLQSHRTKIGYAVLDVSLENLNRAIANSNRVALVIAFMFTGIGVLIAFVLVRSIVRPVQNIAHAADEIAGGDFNQKVLVKRSDEIGVLAESFNRMTQHLKISGEEIEAGTRELEKKHNELKKAYKELETLDKAKDDFLSLVSHELRTPLGSILLHAEMLLNKHVKSEEKQTEYHANIVGQCKRFTRLINDVLDLSKIEAGRMSLAFEPLCLRELLSDVYSSLRPSLESKGLNFNYEAVHENIFLLGDRDKIIQVLTNVISNAIRFTPEGGNITASLTVKEETGTIAIKDTGTGINREDIPKVFDRFSQLENVDHHSEGTGLGMTIAKSIIELHGGSIWIESEPGRGTTVFFTLPLSEERPEHARFTSGDVLPEDEKFVKSSRKPELKKLLIVDDEKTYRQAIADCVQSAGYEPLEAADGDEALRMVEKYQPALIILDVMMPGLSGLEVCRKLKKDPDTGGIKIIMLSARGQEKEKEEGLKAGADRYITKPFDYQELIRAIEELLD